MKTLFYIPTGKTVQIESKTVGMLRNFNAFMEADKNTEQLFFIQYISDKLLFCIHPKELYDVLVSGHHTFKDEGYYVILHRYEFEEIDI